jgi:hypothetical protein
LKVDKWRSSGERNETAFFAAVDQDALIPSNTECITDLGGLWCFVLLLRLKSRNFKKVV